MHFENQLMSTPQENIDIKKTHLFNFLITTNYANYVTINNSNDINLLTLSTSLKNIIQQKFFINNPSLSCLNFNVTDNFVIINTNDISENLRHIDPILDRVLHQTKVCIFDNNSYLPIFYVEKAIKESEFTYAENENSYLKSYIYNKIPNFKEDEFNHNHISIHKNYIGSYLVLFFHNDKWFFLFSNNIYEFNSTNHSILFEHLGQHIDKLDIDQCYHIVLVDVRLRKLITPVCDMNYVVLIKTTEKYTLNESYSNPYDFFVTDHRIYLSCMDELIVRIEELDVKNSRNKKLIHRGFLLKIHTDVFEPMNIAYDTHSYKKIMTLVPKGLSLHEVHLKLYQTDKLCSFLQTINDSYTDIVKRINISMSTMSREILDIYHMTRKKKNSNLYNILPPSYKHILYQLHSDYIIQKNDSDKIIENLCYTQAHVQAHALLNNSKTNISSYNVNMNVTDNHLYLQENYSFDSDDIDGKVSITVDNVYNKLKESDTCTLTELYKDREELIKNIDTMNNNGDSNINELKNPLKSCTTTIIQTKLLSLNRAI